ncbi:hypothetical protein ABFA07_015384 [Porites harrisoni]
MLRISFLFVVFFCIAIISSWCEQAPLKNFKVKSSQRSLHSLLKREGQDRLNYLREAQKPRRMFKEANCMCGINSWNCCRTKNG